MFGFIVLLCIVDIVFGVIACFSPNGWVYGVPVIISAVITIWIAGGANLAYKARTFSDYDIMDIKEKSAENERYLKGLAKRLNVSFNEIKEEADLEEILNKKDIELCEMKKGFKVVLTDIVDAHPRGTVGRFIEPLGNGVYNIGIKSPEGYIVVKCNEKQLENYYLSRFKNL